jgi:hypothetical protein
MSEENDDSQPKLTIEQARLLLKQVVDEAGEDYVYKAHETVDGTRICAYIWNGQPDCIVGRVLHASGLFTLSELNELLQNNSNLISRLTIDTIMYLAVVQSAQDEEKPWGEIVREYR